MALVNGFFSKGSIIEFQRKVIYYGVMKTQINRNKKYTTKLIKEESYVKLDKKSLEQFEAARSKIIGLERERHGIGTLAEKTVHAILKNYYAPNEDYHEVPIENYVADIYIDGRIIEIQTRNFNTMRGKLETFLKQYPVTIVYPVPNVKQLIWINEETGELSKKRKSPVKGNIYAIFKELYKIKMFLKNPNLHLRLVLLDMEEYRLLNGWSKDKKKGSTRYDRIPTALVDELTIDCLQDYLQFLPYDLPEQFTTADFAKKVKITRAVSQVTLNLLHYVGVVERVGKQGNYYVYHVVE